MCGGTACLSVYVDTGLESLCRKLPSLKVVDNLAQVGELVKQQRRGRWVWKHWADKTKI